MNTKNILNIGSLAIRDDSIIRKEYYPYGPYTSALGNSDEIRIAIQNKDAYLLPCESYLYVQVTATTTGTHAANDAEIFLVNNFVSFLFSDVRYELNGVEIDRLRNVGRSSTIKLLVASRKAYLTAFHLNSKAYESHTVRSAPLEANTLPPVKTFDFAIPLSVWFGFCDDYRKIILNSKHELILNRANNTLDCVHGGGVAETAARVTLALTKIQWKMPHVTLSDSVKLGMLNYLSKNRKIIIQYRSADMVVYPELPQSNTHMWAVKTVSHVNRPRYVVVGFQTNRSNSHVPDASKFDHCNITSVRLHLNSQIYPYNMNEYNMSGGQYTELFIMYRSIQSSYYNDTEPLNPFNLTYAGLQACTLFPFDTSRADESLIDSSVDIKIEIKAAENIPANTAAFCLIIHDNQFTYSPFDSVVMRTI